MKNENLTPRQLALQKEQLTQRHQEILDFILLGRLMDIHYPTFYKSLKREMKMRMSNFTSNLNQLLSILKTNLSAEHEEYLDENAATAWEVLQEFNKAENKEMFKAVCIAYNAGGVVSQEEAMPVNDKAFPGLLKDKAKAA